MRRAWRIMRRRPRTGVERERSRGREANRRDEARPRNRPAVVAQKQETRKTPNNPIPDIDSKKQEQPLDNRPKRENKGETRRGEGGRRLEDACSLACVQRQCVAEQAVVESERRGERRGSGRRETREWESEMW